jgi:hypothetical protein
MEFAVGSRVSARGLIWDVLEVDRSGGHERFSLRCADGDMSGLEWEAYVPPDEVDQTVDVR